MPDVRKRFDGFSGDLLILPSAAMTSIENRYLDISHEEDQFVKSQADPFVKEDLEGFGAAIYHLGGLVYGDFSDSFIRMVAARGDVALDVQCLLRHGEGVGQAMTYQDWETKKTFYLRLNI